MTEHWAICADAIALWPRPDWLVVLIGHSPHDGALTEMLHRDDRATVEEWGGWGMGL
jgi:hypothetical protein